MNKIFLIVFFNFISFSVNSQQVIKKVTDTSTNTIIELYSLRNGVSNENIVGDNNFNLQEWNFDRIRFYNEDGSIFYNWHYPYPPQFANVSLNDPELICEEPFQLYFTLIGGYFDYFQSSTGEILNIKVLELAYQLDALQDNDNLEDVYKLEYRIPKILNNGTQIPTNTWLVCKSRIGIDTTQSLTLSSKRIGFKFDGLTWVIQSYDWNGNSFDIVDDTCISLKTDNTEYNFSKTTIFPNPTFDYIIITNSQNSNDFFNYIISDFTGRIVKKGESKLNEKIIISELLQGNYMISINNQKMKKDFKIIKL